MKPQNSTTDSWPWTKDLAHAVADPIEPLDEYDDRPSIKELIQKHDKKIFAMKAELKSDPLYEPNKHDDLWILRFLMSHKNKVKPALEAAKYTLAFRHKHQLDKADVRKLQPSGKDSYIEAMRLFSKHNQPGAIDYTMPDTQRGVVVFYHSTLMDTHKIVEEFDEHPHWLNYHMNLSEWTYQWNDYVSRKTGRLTKCMVIVNSQGLGVSGWNKEYQERNKRANAEYELCYPQKVGSFFFLNVPQWVYPAWRIVRLFLSKRIIEKMDAIDPHGNPQDKAKLWKYISEGLLPERFGGSYQPWPVEYPTNDEEKEQQNLQAQDIEIILECKVSETDPAAEEGSRPMATQMSPQNGKLRKKTVAAKIKNFLRRRKRNGKGVSGGQQGDLVVEKRRGEMPEATGSTTFFSAPLACVENSSHL